MKKLLVATILLGCTSLCFGQKNLISYDDIKYLLQNNLNMADTFLVAKGYLIAKKDNKTKNRKYSVTFRDGTYSNLDLRSDGKRLFIEIETNELSQYNLIRESISQYLTKDSQIVDVQVYAMKDLGSIYITVNDIAPYNPIKKDYDIHIVGDKSITAYN
jgi:predicted house-cleaning NTP pyrophosphatase (Maf/HAM1 superfamily)